MEFDDITVMLPAIAPVIPTTAVVPHFPEVYIDVPGCGIDLLGAVPAKEFGAWIKAQAEDAWLIAAILGVDRSRWSLEEKWRVISELMLRGVDLPLVTSDVLDSPEEETVVLPVVGGGR